MKLVGMLIALLIISLVMIMMLRGSPFGGDGAGAPPDHPPSERFMARCTEAAPQQLPRPEEYCRCLWSKGVTDLVQLMTDKQRLAAAEACRAAQRP